MPNGELRFRLMPSDGNGYIRTVAGACGAWQRAHYHHQLRETYIVERGWIALAEWEGRGLTVKRYGPGEIFTTEPNRSHNIYMAAGAIIHTVKHGGQQDRDWQEDSALSAITDSMTEDDIRRLALSSQPQDRFGNYIDLYNNLDNLLWSIPNLLAAGATIIVGFFISIITKNAGPPIPPIMFSIVFLFSGILFYLGYVSMSRLREHHSLVGEQLAKMETGGYFAVRNKNVARWWPIAAPNQFRIVYAALAIVLFAASIACLIWPRVTQVITS